MKIYEIQNYRKFNIKFISPTDNRGAGVRISEPKRYNTDKTKKCDLAVLLRDRGHCTTRTGVSNQVRF